MSMELKDLGWLEDDGVIDWEHILDDVPENGLDFLDDEATGTGALDIDEIEQWLMNDDDNNNHIHIDEFNKQGCLSDGFDMSDILLFNDTSSSEPEPEPEPEVVDASSSPEDKISNSNSPSDSGSEGNIIVDVNVDANTNINTSTHNFEKMDKDTAVAVAVAVELEATDSKEDEDDDTDDNPDSKKRKRQLRNRDAAMRSRERKKMYVKDLEMKSRYLEAECRRLGRLLQCCYAENQMLRVSMQSGSAFGAMSKPESAVLLLESLLLVSLAWCMALICLLPLPRLLLLNQEAVALGSVNRKDLESAAPREKGTEALEVCLPLSFLTSKRCRASRTRMKSGSDFEFDMMFVRNHLSLSPSAVTSFMVCC